MRILPFVFLLLMGMTWKCVNCTCVLETDFGLTINCGLKKSGMFRVRNLGGLKGYVGVGLQLADELGFKESLSSLEQNSKRRSVNGLAAPGSFEPLTASQNTNNQLANAIAILSGKNVNLQDRSAYAKMNGRQSGNTPATVPPFRPLIAAANNAVRNVRLAAQQQQPQSFSQKQQQLQLQPQSFSKKQQQQPPSVLKPLPVPEFAALPQSIAKVTVETTSAPPQLLVSHRKSPMAVAMIDPPPSAGRFVVPQMVQPMTPAALVPQQQPSPVFIPQTQPQTSVYYHNAMLQAANRRYNEFAQNSQNSIEKRQPIIVMPEVENQKKKSSVISNEVDSASASMMSLFNAAAANNVSVEQLAMALRQYHQVPQQSSSGPVYLSSISTTEMPPKSTTEITTSSSKTTSPQQPSQVTEGYVPDEPQLPKKISIKPYKSKYSSSQKVMNAPKEYYPVGYDKNFDDNFVSKVDLPDTSFSCGDQKHFPGLYGDEDLGCMVFHVCAFTDDGLTQKSFLCPESTLFDQTILKCNWWFYVDCKSSKKLYDSNIPISKSYQLMKALTFFSSYAAGPTVDASLAAATAAVSSNPDSPPAHVKDSVGTIVDIANTTVTTTVGTTEKPEILDNVSFKR